MFTSVDIATGVKDTIKPARIVDSLLDPYNLFTTVSIVVLFRGFFFLLLYLVSFGCWKDQDER